MVGVDNSSTQENTQPRTADVLW